MQALTWSVLMVGALAIAASAQSWPVPLVRAYAHNDQENGEPLYPALDAGFCNVEPDVFLQNGRVVIGHNCNIGTCNTTIEEGYFTPLAERYVQHTYIQPLAQKLSLCKTLTFNIDVKTDAYDTFDMIHASLAEYQAQYPGLFTTFDQRSGSLVVTPGAVLVLFSGNRIDPEDLLDMDVRYAALDGRILENIDDDSENVQHLYPWLSDNWTNIFRSTAVPFSPETEAEVRTYVTTAAARGQLIRFWNVPNTPEFYSELVRCDVPLLNCDDYEVLQEFLLS